jgi:hypothetical protein
MDARKVVVEMVAMVQRAMLFTLACSLPLAVAKTDRSSIESKQPSRQTGGVFRARLRIVEPGGLSELPDDGRAMRLL